MTTTFEERVAAHISKSVPLSEYPTNDPEWVWPPTESGWYEDYMLSVGKTNAWHGNANYYNVMSDGVIEGPDLEHAQSEHQTPSTSGLYTLDYEHKLVRRVNEDGTPYLMPARLALLFED